jgi:GNAT superfamily N-acetyltransferase
MKVTCHEFGITNIYSSFNSDSFNSVIGGDFSQPKTQMSASNIVNFYKNQHQAFTWYIPSSTFSKDAHRVLIQLGLKNIYHINSMVVLRDNIKIRTYFTKHLNIKGIKNDKTLHDFSSILELFNSNANQYYKMVQEYLIKNANISCYVGYLNKIPVCTGSVYVDENIICLYDLITLLEFRKQGFATQMINYMIKDVERSKKAKFVGLQASNEGVYLYPKLGFQNCGSFYLYSIECRS